MSDFHDWVERLKLDEPESRMLTGIAFLDQCLRLAAGTIVVCHGVSESHKTTLASVITLRALNAGNQVLYVAKDGGIAAFVKRLRPFVTPLLAEHLLLPDPSVLSSMDQVLADYDSRADKGTPTLIVVDSLQSFYTENSSSDGRHSTISIEAQAVRDWIVGKNAVFFATSEETGRGETSRIADSRGYQHKADYVIRTSKTGGKAIQVEVRKDRFGDKTGRKTLLRFDYNTLTVSTSDKVDDTSSSSSEKRETRVEKRARLRQEKYRTIASKIHAVRAAEPSISAEGLKRKLNISRTEYEQAVKLLPQDASSSN